ncbi:MAG: polysaccharide deacetylase family protein [Chitinophagaceae bacterium]|nr:polysaccharide deacetylase family protein [Chitinophagaceae bacterium]
MMKAIMYHYVRMPDAAYPYFRFLHFDDFKKQLDYFSQNFLILHPSVLNEQKTTNGIILTFDDGVKDHIDFVLPELQKRNLSAIFYISTGVYDKNKLLDVHRLHVLLGKFGGKHIYDTLQNYLKDEMLIDTHVDEFKRLTYNRQLNDEYTLLAKRIINYFISYDYREWIMDRVMEDLVKDEEKLFWEFYLSEKDIQQMQDAGMIIGSHTVNHKVMSKLSFEEQDIEICNSFSTLEQITDGLPVRTFCYPYGGYHTFTEETEKLLEQHNCSFAFNVEPRDIELKDMLYRRQALPRYDCNLFPYGKIREN